MTTVRGYKDLEVWQRAMNICVNVYKMTQSLPKSENFGLTNQMRRAAVSIPSNIAEGHARPRRDFARFLQIALGSLNEVETQLELSKRIGYLQDDDSSEIVQELAILGRQLNALKNKLRD
ncbi:MAG: four helix bundle protein [Chloroflexota bacterium]